MVKYATGNSDKGKIKRAAAASKRKKAAEPAKPKAKPRAKKPEPLPDLTEKQQKVLRALRMADAEVETIATTFSVDVDTARRLIERQDEENRQTMATAVAAAADAGDDGEEDDYDPTLVGGRPTLWRPEFVRIGQQLASLGATDLEISQALDCSVRTIHRWKLEHPEFRKALEQGKEIIDDKVEESLLKRATGYTFDSEKVVVVDKELQRVQTVEHVPPDIKAAMFWLQNRRPALWRATQTIKHDIEPESPLAKFLSDVSGVAFQPVDQDGLAENDTDEEPQAFAPSSDEQEPSPDEAV